MVVPFGASDELLKLPVEAAHEMMGYAEDGGGAAEALRARRINLG